MRKGATSLAVRRRYCVHEEEMAVFEPGGRDGHRSTIWVSTASYIIVRAFPSPYSRQSVTRPTPLPKALPRSR